MKKRFGWIIAGILSLGLVAVGCSSSKSAEKEEDAAQGKMAEKEMAEEEAAEEAEAAEQAAQEEMAEAEAAEEAAAAEESGPAIGGYCPVAYKMADKPMKGQEEFAVEHDGKTWYMANEKAMKAFEENPANFEVKYAGWCATGLSMGKQVKADPTIFTVHNEKVYLFSSEEAKEKFEAKADAMAEKAESNWTAMQSEGAEEGAEKGMDESAEEGM
ncbi:MAG: YHS domain-containing (seleno)protein [Myxococcota bacterium]